jgi:hypothetical protein
MLIIYPNPAREQATMQGDFKGTAMPAQLELFDSAGRLVRSLSVASHDGSWQVPLEGLAAGVYSAHLKDKNGKKIAAGQLIKS